MVKVKGPLHSQDARGTLGGVLSFQGYQRGVRVERKPVHRDARSVAQEGQRAAFLEAVAYWKGLSAEEKAEFEERAGGLGMTGYNLCLREVLLGVIAMGAAHQVQVVQGTAGDYTTTSLVFVDVDTDNLVVTMTTGDSWVLLILSGSLYVGSIKYGCFDFTVDGSRQGGGYGVISAQSAYEDPLVAVALVQVEAGEHIFRPQWRVTGGFARLRASPEYSPTIFAVVELK